MRRPTSRRRPDGSARRADSETRTRRPAGGAATAGGMEFQHRAAAWLAVRVLAESEAPSLWGLPAVTNLEWLRCETDQPVDDLTIGTSTGGGVFGQVKHTVDLSARHSSELGAAVDQFVRQVGACRTASAGDQPWERPLDTDRDRLVLIVGPTTSAAVRVDLPAVLERLRGLPPTRSLRRAAANEREARALEVVLTHIRRSWRAAFGCGPSDAELREFLSMLHVQPLDVDSGGGHEREAKQVLSASIVSDPAEVDAVWALLLRACAGSPQVGRAPTVVGSSASCSMRGSGFRRLEATGKTSSV